MPKFYKTHLLTPPHLLEAPHSQVSEEFVDESFINEQNPIKPLLSWHAPSRPFRKKDRSYYTTIAILLILISMISLLAGEKLLIVVILSLGFMVYVLNFIPPHDEEYKLSTQGVTIGDNFFHWEQLDSFWINEKDNYKMLNILTRYGLPGVLVLPIGDLNEEEIKRAVARFLPFHEIAPKSFIDKWSEKLQKHFPLENPHR